MKILSIELENFASHIHSKIDLSQIISATVSGKNGSGKSTAFVDAPLWCLFGKCRAEADSIMAHDQLRMSVTLHFSLDGQEYFVQRIRSKATKAGKTELSFMAVNNSVYIPIGGHKITETQEAIKNVLNADYELMANCNFLIQGHADRFSVASPAERKSILSQVLRLDEYSILRTIASRKVAVIGDFIEGKQTLVNPLELQVAGIMDKRLIIKESEQLMQDISTRQLDHNEKTRIHFEVKGKKQAQLNEILGNKEGLEELYKEYRALQSKLDKNIIDQEGYRRLILRKEKITTGEAVYAAVVQTMSLEKDVDVGLMKGLLELENEIRTTQDKKARELQTLIRVEAELQGLEHKKELIGSQFTVEMDKAHKSIGDDLEKGKLLDVVPCYKELQEKCQFTIQAVQVMSTIETKRAQLGILEKRNFLREQLPNYEKDYETRLEQIKNLKLTPTGDKLKELNQRKETIIQKQAEQKAELLKLQKEAELVEPIAKLKPALDSALKDVEMLSEVYKTGQDLLHNLNNEIQKKTRNQDLETELATWLAKAFSIEDYLKNQETFLAGEIQGITDRLARVRLECEQAELSQGRLSELKEELSNLGGNQAALKVLHTYYQTIPVMIMEGAVPTLEAATNTILEKISPSGMRVRLETQKALKTSDRLGETLDILVRDVFGEKPYENYSGGEKFRLDLALRFGLSQLLMHRAGSKLETLIIDEGLGSLDGDGLALLRECLSKLETNFGLILVISHVEDIQGTFEQQIMVKKNATGSEIQIL